MSRELRINARAFQHKGGTRQIGKIGVLFAGKNGVTGQATLLRQFDFVIPVGAFD